MTSPTQPDDRTEGLFIADFYPGLGAYLASRHARGYDAVAARARFLLWLAAHANDGPVDYLARAVRVPRLTAEEETSLARRHRAGRRAEEELALGGDTLGGETRADLERIVADGTAARDRLAEANLWLVVSLAERFTGRGVPYPDLIQAGNRGLTRAVHRYDPAKGYGFATYATWWIRQAITRALADRLRDIPAARPGPGAGVEHAGPGDGDGLTLTERRVQQDLGREPTPEELAAELDLSPR